MAKTLAERLESEYINEENYTTNKHAGYNHPVYPGLFGRFKGSQSQVAPWHKEEK